MNIHQIIYTKVDLADSPWRKNDFHMVFYPVELLTQKDVLDIEKKIHISELSRIDAKRTVFFQRINDELYLGILCFKHLPNDRDAFGRGGLFLVHGFLFPQSIWRRCLTPRQLLMLVEDKMFTDRSNLLNSTLIDRNTGNIHPLEVSARQVEELESTQRPCAPQQIEMAQLLFNIARGAGRKLLIKGSPEQVFEFMCDAIALVPDDLKDQLGWDSSFDGSSMFYSRFNIAGYENRQPAAQDPIVIDVSTWAVRLKSGDESAFTPVSACQKWLTCCANKVVQKAEIERVYRLSCILDQGQQCQFTDRIPTSEKSAFVMANEDKIRQVFTMQCRELLGHFFAKFISRNLQVPDMFDLLVKNMPAHSLANHLATAIYTSQLSPTRESKHLPEPLVASGMCELTLINRIWRGGTLSIDDLKPLSELQTQNLIRYLLHSRWSSRQWFIDLLLDTEDLCHNLLSDPDYKEKMRTLQECHHNTMKGKLTRWWRGKTPLISIRTESQ